MAAKDIRFRQKLRERAFDLIGRQCIFCDREIGDEEVKDGELVPVRIHASHILPTNLNGAGRGLERRFRDVLNNPDKYRPMCKKHHRIFDRLVCGLAQVIEEMRDREIPWE